MQVVVGVLNVLLLAPVWMQLVHLLVADLLWIALVLLGATVLRSTGVHGGVHGRGTVPGVQAAAVHQRVVVERA